LVEYVSLLTDLHKKPAVMFLARRAEPLGEVQSVRPGDVARNRVPENSLECAPIPIQDPVRRRQLALPRIRLTSTVPQDCASSTPRSSENRWLERGSRTEAVRARSLALSSVAHDDSHTPKFAPQQRCSGESDVECACRLTYVVPRLSQTPSQRPLAASSSLRRIEAQRVGTCGSCLTSSGPVTTTGLWPTTRA